ncbi:MAG TPA: HAD family acid phosphatase [Marmoricola sp.]|jgi:hypothetical protein|nr:HAD family acid phosphatase [Marmoricola sp.]
MRRLTPAIVLTCVLTWVLAFVALTAAVPVASASNGLPAKKVWLSDVSTAMHGSQAYLRARIADAQPGQRLAINLDIDNTSLATKYAPGKPILVVRSFTRYAHEHGVAVFFNTGRGPAAAAQARRLLRQAGYTVDRLCGRRNGEALVHSKKRCRSSFAAAGYTIVANVGNRSTDFAGSGYGRAFKLPNYGNRLG